jgi:hypothetical protein
VCNEQKWSCLLEQRARIVLRLSNSPVCRDVAGLFIMYEHGVQCTAYAVAICKVWELAIV